MGFFEEHSLLFFALVGAFSLAGGWLGSELREVWRTRLGNRAHR